MRKLVLRSSEWLRGNAPDVADRRVSVLWSEIYKRGCCLGLCGIQSGLSPDLLSGNFSPAYLEDDYGGDAGLVWMLKAGAQYAVDSDDAAECMAINDDPFTNDEQKIAKLRPIFERNGWEIDWRPDE